MNNISGATSGTGSKKHLKTWCCEYCGKEVKGSPSNLRDHINGVHLKVKPFKCRFCSSTFTVNSNRKSHEAVHLKENPLRCRFCSTYFTLNANRKSHEIRCHFSDLRRNSVMTTEEQTD